MSSAGLDTLPKDILRDIHHIVAQYYLREGNEDEGLRQCCKLAGALPCLSRVSLPPVPLTQWERKTLSWEGDPSRILCRASKGSPKTWCEGLNFTACNRVPPDC